jgi:hypothetical protein
MRFSNGLLSLALTGLLLATQATANDHWGLKPGTIDLKSAGALTFGPDGVLFVGDAIAGAVYAIQTNDARHSDSQADVNIEGLQSRLAKTLGVSESEVKVNDLAVNPVSQNIYLSVSVGKPAQAALVRIDAAGKLSKVSLNVPHSRAVLTDAPESKAGRRGNPRHDAITDLAYREGKVLVAGLAKGQSPSTVREFAFPFGDGATATNIEIYHAAHGRVEDHAAVRTFVPLIIDGEPSLLAGFTCTPLVRFPIKALEPGAKVRGTTVAELGNHNRPLDMVVYEKEGQSYVLMANSARGVMKVSMANVQDNPGLTEPVKGGGTAGQPYETISELQGVEQLDLLNETHAVILAKTKTGGLDLSTVALP